MQTELTIAEMSEVVAKYMGWEYNTSLGQTRLYAIHQDWNRLHEVWGKVREEIESNFIPFNGSNLSMLYFTAGGSISRGIPPRSPNIHLRLYQIY